MAQSLENKGRWDVPFFGRVGHYFPTKDYSDTPICGKIFRSVFSGHDMSPISKCKRCVKLVSEGKLQSQIKQKIEEQAI